MKRALTTLFLLSSIDGKISTGSDDRFDFDKDLPLIAGAKEGLDQYYQIEKTTDKWSLCSGRTQVKIGINNENPEIKHETGVNFVIIDNKQLEINGIRSLCSKAEQLVIVTTNERHNAIKLLEDNDKYCSNLHCIVMPKLDPEQLLCKLYEKYGCESITIQSGGTLNSLFLRRGLIDRIKIVIAPILVGGKDVPTIADGGSPISIDELAKHGVYELTDIIRLKDSYVELDYKKTGR